MYTVVSMYLLKFLLCRIGIYFTYLQQIFSIMNSLKYLLTNNSLLHRHTVRVSSGFGFLLLSCSLILLFNSSWAFNNWKRYMNTILVHVPLFVWHSVPFQLLLFQTVAWEKQYLHGPYSLLIFLVLPYLFVIFFSFLLFVFKWLYQMVCFINVPLFKHFFQFGMRWHLIWIHYYAAYSRKLYTCSGVAPSSAKIRGSAPNFNKT